MTDFKIAEYLTWERIGRRCNSLEAAKRLANQIYGREYALEQTIEGREVFYAI